MDALHLSLQNLLYEKTHILKEIKRCHLFRSEHDAIKMVPEVQFIAESSEGKFVQDSQACLPSIEYEPTSGRRTPSTNHTLRSTPSQACIWSCRSASGLTKISLPPFLVSFHSYADAAALAVDPHKKMLARLDHEGKERIRLAEQLSKLKTEKEQMANKNEKKGIDLASLPGHLKKILEVAKSYENVLGDRDSITVSEDSPARQLPVPLYILYTNLAAFVKIHTIPVHVPQCFRAHGICQHVLERTG